MSIEPMEGVSNPVIIQWIRKFAKILRKRLDQGKIREDVRSVEIIELDELFSYCQKKLKSSIYGLLLI